MHSKQTGVQTNQGHSSNDDFITRTYILPLLTDPAIRERLIAEHRANPIGRAAQNGHPAIEHSLDLRTVLDKFRRQPMPGKYVIVCKRLHEDYRIGIVSGVRGKPVDIQDDSFSSEEACEHAIFLKRIANLLQQYA